MFEPGKSHRSSTLTVIIAVAIIGAAFVVQCIGAWQDSQTTDEAVHLAAGRSYWQTGDFRLNPEHPPLIKLLAATPLLFRADTRIDTASRFWANYQEWQVGIQLLYASPYSDAHARMVMFLGRLPMIIVWATLGWVMFAWSRSRWGHLAGLVALTVFAFDPNFLGHGHLVTTDVGLTLGFVTTIWLADRFFRQPSWPRLAWLALVFGLTQVTKFSGVLLWLLLPLLGLLRLAYGRSVFTGRWWWMMIAGCVLMTSILTWGVYGFQVQRIDTDPRIAQLWQERQRIIDQGGLEDEPPIVQRIVRWSDPTTATGQFLMRASHWSVPAYSYWRGLASTTSHDVYGHPAYLLGQTRDEGWWYYFPVALLVKTPLVTLLLVLLSFGFGLFRFFRWPRGTTWSTRIPFDAWLLGLPPLLYLAWAMTSHINIGVRHIFPVEPFLFLAVGSLATWSRLPSPRFWRGVIIVLCALLPITTWRAWPRTIGYFSEVIGRQENGYRYLLDSNLDWNQDIWRLQSFLDQHRFPEVHLVLFGSIPYRTVFPTTLDVLTTTDIERGVRPTGIVIISAGQLYNQDGPFAWLRDYHPTWRVGSSINAYDFR